MDNANCTFADFGTNAPVRSRVSQSKMPTIKAILRLYIYTSPFMINRISGLNNYDSSEWSCLISFAWDPLSCSEQVGIEKFKMKVYVSVPVCEIEPSCQLFPSG